MRSRIFIGATLLTCGALLASTAAHCPAQPPPAAPQLNVITAREFDKRPGSVTKARLVAKAMPLADALAELSRQTAIEMKAETGAEKVPVSVDFPQPVPFWHLMRSLLQSANLQYRKTGAGLTIGKADDMEDAEQKLSGPTVQNGSFLVSASSISRNRLQVQLFEDPKVRAVYDGIRVRMDRSVDDTGRPYEDPKNDGPAAGFDGPNSSGRRGRFGGRNGGGPMNYTLALANVSPFSESLASVKCTFLVPVWTGVDRWEINDLLQAANVVRKTGNWTLKLQNARKVGDEYVVSIAATIKTVNSDFYQTVSNDRSLLMAITQSMHDAALLDAAGHPLASGETNIGYHWNGDAVQTAMTLDLTLNFTAAPTTDAPAAGVPAATLAAGEPLKFVWNLPAAITHVIVPFEFKNLPLH